MPSLCPTGDIMRTILQEATTLSIKKIDLREVEDTNLLIKRLIMPHAFPVLVDFVPPSETNQ
jgi:hypothetical protein